MDKKTIEKVDLKGKRVFIRADFNVPFDENGNITDDGRIRSTLPTINYALDAGAKVILASHLGRPKGKPNSKYSLSPVALRLNRLLNKEVKFAKDCIGPDVEHLVAGMRPGDVLLLENLRFHAEEEKNDEGFSKALAAFTDVYVNDAFGTAHRAHASTYGITKYVKQSVAGFLMKKEIEYLQKTVANPVRPFVAILGGAKVSGKIGVIENLQNKVDKIIVGGAMAFTFIKARGQETGNSLVEDDMLDMAQRLRKGVRDKGVKFYLPVDFVVAENTNDGAETKIVTSQEIPKGWVGLDIGPATTRLFAEALQDAKTIIWNGPMGLFEKDAYSRGTFAIARAVADAYATTIVGGGDTDVAVHKAGVSDSITFISTGGGASLELLEGKELPGLAALTDDKE
ncbi:MAG: phosphoglycerate kinase [Nitrospirae bacterium GWD2_57_9]|nr:MAG: phosphoglycerate kinase [Nitrospirae bacterium GWD2_57_9]OGW48353.1 MAG: phosphoglycerate kinase [Nitrospirae bacterium GWC2_57_9]